MEQPSRNWTRVDLVILGAVFILLILAIFTSSSIRNSNAVDTEKPGTGIYKSYFICGKTGTSQCKVGQIGPGGGTIFFVDYDNEFNSFNFLEAAPAGWNLNKDLMDPTFQWCSDITHKITSPTTWNSRQIGAGKLNTVEMLKTCKSGAAFEVQKFNNGKINKYSDWFLPSEGELMLMSANLQGLADLDDLDYWSSSEYSEIGGWVEAIGHGYQGSASKNTLFHVRPIRQF